MPTRSRAAKDKVTSADIWKGHLDKDTMLPVWAGCVRSRAAGHLRHGEKDIWTSPCVQPSVRLTSGQETPSHVCRHQASGAIPLPPVEVHAARPSDICRQLTSGTSPTPAMENELILMQLRHGRQGRGRGGAGSGRGSCRTWKSCRHQVKLPCRFMQHAHAPDIRQDIRLRHLDIWTRSRLPLQHAPHASAPLRETSGSVQDMELPVPVRSSTSSSSPCAHG